MKAAPRQYVLFSTVRSVKKLLVDSLDEEIMGYFRAILQADELS
jgi:hypothetical protein